jgi:hypothetical protein
MAYIKTDWTDGMVISEAGLDHLENGVYNNSVAIGDLTDLDTTDKTNLVAAINEAAQSGGGGGGMSNAVKDALLQIASKVAYIDEDGQDYYDDLYNALYPAAEIVSINAEYTQTGTVYTTTSLEDLRNDLVVTAIYDNGSVVPVISYTLSGTLTVGESTITATYSGFTDTFDVTVSAAPTVSSIAAVYTQSGTVYDTDSLDSLKTDLVVTATYSDSSTATVPSADYTLSGTLTVGTSTITVTYEGKTTTFNVTVSNGWRYLPSMGLLSAQDFVTTSGTAEVTETIVGDALRLYGAVDQSSPFKSFMFTPSTLTSWGKYKFTFKAIDVGYLLTNNTSSQGHMAFRLSNGTNGASFGIARYGSSSAAVKCRYQTSSSLTWGPEVSLNEWHTVEITIENNKQKITMDDSVIIENANLGSSYVTSNRINFALSDSNVVDIYIKSIEYTTD